MRRLSLALISTVSALAFTQFASAADLPRKAPAYMPPPPPVLTWNGWYIGLNAGGIWSNCDVTHTAFAGPCNVGFPGCTAVPNFSQTLAAESTFTAGDGNQAAFTIGGQFGYNYQFSPIGVVGFEADINWNDRHDSDVTFNALAHNPNFPAENEIYSATISRRLDFFGTVRGRLGFLATPALLLYGTAGLAYGGAHSSTNESVNNPNCLGGTVPACVGAGGGDFSETRVGWTAGGGVEWKFAPNWSAKIEGLWYDLGTAHYATALQQNCVQATCAVPGGLYASTTGETSVRFDGAIARVGVNYHF